MAQGLIPIIIGVTGHRDLRPQDIPALESGVNDILTGLRRRYPHTPLLLLSPLAEGADRLAARVALSQGAELVVPMPMPRKEYEKDFTTPESRQELVDLLARAKSDSIMPMVDGNTLHSISKPGPARDKQYAQVGAYIARHSQILIALWDGKATDFTGGTAQIVHFKLDGIPEPYTNGDSLFDVRDKGLVYHVATPRQSNPEPAGEPYKLQILFPQGWKDEVRPVTTTERIRHVVTSLGDRIPGVPKSEYRAAMKAYHRIFRHIDFLNAQVDQGEREIGRRIADSKAGFYPDDDARLLPASLQALRERYAVADALAVPLQNLRSRLLVLFVISFLLGIGLILAVSDFSMDPEIRRSLGYSTIAVWCIYMSLYFWRKHIQNKVVDYRALAEGLRVHFFWKLAGIKEDITDHHLRFQKDSLEWIRHTIHVCDLAADHYGNLPHGSFPFDEKMRVGLAFRHWVERQRDYYDLTMRRDRKRLEEQVSLINIANIVLLAVVCFWLIYGRSDRIPLLNNLLEQGSKLESLKNHVVTVVFLVAVALGWLSDALALPEQVRRYYRMSTDLSTIAHDYADCMKRGDLEGARRQIREMGRKALVENGEWVLLHRERHMIRPGM